MTTWSLLRIRIARDPALIWIGLLAPVVQLALSYTPWPAVLITALDAAAVALAGVLTAAMVRRDHLVPAITGLAQALLVVGLALGVPIDATQRALLMSIVGFALAGFVRTQVAPRTPAPMVIARHAA